MLISQAKVLLHFLFHWLALAQLHIVNDVVVVFREAFSIHPSVPSFIQSINPSIRTVIHPVHQSIHPSIHKQ
jgi:hypothetical protein